MPPGFFFAAFNKMHEDGDNRKEGLVRKRSHDFIVFKTLCLSLQQDATVNKCLPLIVTTKGKLVTITHKKMNRQSKHSNNKKHQNIKKTAV